MNDTAILERLAADLGCEVTYDVLAKEELPSLLYRDLAEDEITICVNSQLTLEQRAGRLAHELGHHVFGHAAFPESTEPNPGEDQEADAFARHLISRVQERDVPLHPEHWQARMDVLAGAIAAWKSEGCSARKRDLIKVVDRVYVLALLFSEPGLAAEVARDSDKIRRLRASWQERFSAMIRAAGGAASGVKDEQPDRFSIFVDAPGLSALITHGPKRWTAQMLDSDSARGEERQHIFADVPDELGAALEATIRDAIGRFCDLPHPTHEAR